MPADLRPVDAAVVGGSRSAAVSAVERPGPDVVLEQADDLTGFGMAADVVLGEDEIAVDGDVEHALVPGDQFDRHDGGGPPPQQFVRQTDGTGDVVSGDAERDGHAVLGVEHGRLLGG